GGNPPYVIQVLNLDGSGRHPIDTPPMNRMDANPAWSPDGSAVWFNRGLPAVGCGSQSQIYVAPASGPAGVLVSKDASVSEYEAAPSPDGTQVAFVRCDDTTNDLHHVYTMNTVGLNIHPVTSGSTVDDYFPDWQPTAPQFSSAPSISGHAVD